MHDSPSQMAYLRKRKRRRLLVHIGRVVLLLVLLALWEIAANLGWIDDFIFSSPSRIALCGYDMARDGTLWKHLSVTLFVTLVSFLIVTVVTVLAALLLWLSRTVSEILEPYLVVLNSLPKSALAPLLIVWLGNNTSTIIVAGISVAIFGSVLTLYTHFSETDEEKIKLIYTLGGTRLDVLTKLILPGSIPVLISNMKVNIGLCLIGIVIGEMISSQQGLGYLIIYGTQVFKLDWVLLSIFILCLIAMALYFSLSFLEKRISRHF